MGLRASLYSSLATKVAEQVFKSNGAQRPWGSSAWESWQGKGVAKVTGEGIVRRAGKWCTLTCTGPLDDKGHLTCLRTGGKIHVS